MIRAGRYRATLLPASPTTWLGYRIENVVTRKVTEHWLPEARSTRVVRSAAREHVLRLAWTDDEMRGAA